MTDELLNKANELSERIKKIDDSICKIEYEFKVKKKFDKDIIQGYKGSSYKFYLKSFASVFFRKDKKPSIRANAEFRYPVEIELDDEEFFPLLLDYMKNKKSKLQAELDKL